MPELILVDTIDRGIASVTLNRPERRNALSIDLLEQLCVAIERLASDPCAAGRDPAQRRSCVFEPASICGRRRTARSWNARLTAVARRLNLLQTTPADLDCGRTGRGICRRGRADGGV